MTLDRDLVAAALPNYEINGEIGRGGWGIVLRGRHRALGREVAIKQLPTSLADGESALERFVDEARIIGQLDHPHIVKVYDFVEHDGLWLIVMEYLSGGTLWSRYTEKGLRSDQACAITMAVCAGLDAAHDQGVLHRDIKPENILFTHEGIPRLGDFGIAKDVDSDMRRTRVGEVVGTPTYMSPEQAMDGELTPACDVYSLGVVLYELLAGRLPFEEARTPTQQLIQHATEPPLMLSAAAPEVPAAIAEVVMDTLEKRPEDRTPTAQAFGVALARAAGETYGSGWLRESGIRLMGGGRIDAAAHRAPTMGAPTRAVTHARPAIRADHFRNAEGSESGSPGGAATEARPAATPPPTSGAAPTMGVAIAPQAETAAVSAVESPGGRNRLPVVLGVIAAAAVIVVVALVALSGGGGDDVETVGADIAPATTAATTTTPTPTAPTTTVVAAPITTAAPTTAPTMTGAPPTTTVVEVPTCVDAARCAVIDSVTVDGDSYVINWTATGFEPSYVEGFFHVHFFWDIYSPDQVGTNASTFGVSQGSWELTDQQSFRSGGELRVSNRPVPANQICVTPVNFAHAVVDPREFDCVPIPEGV